VAKRSGGIPRPPAAFPAASAAFSLIEVTLAIGIVAFAFVPLFGLLPTGMNAFRQSSNNTVTAQIAQRVMNDCQQSDFSELITDANGNPISGITGCKAVRYFDNQANELSAAGTPAIYWVNTAITPATNLPAGAVNANLATLIIQVASNPANQTLLSGTNSLWTGATSSNPSTAAVQIATYSGMVSNNSGMVQ
jgi:uncharacterized protein (TIGR02598 family)